MIKLELEFQDAILLREIAKENLVKYAGPECDIVIGDYDWPGTHWCKTHQKVHELQVSKETKEIYYFWRHILLKMNTLIYPHQLDDQGEDDQVMGEDSHLEMEYEDRFRADTDDDF